METTTRLLLPDVIEALHSDPRSVVELTEELHPADLADIAAALDLDLAALLIRTLPVPEAAKLLAVLERGRRIELYTRLATENLEASADLAEMMPPDDRADLFAELPEDLRGSLLARMERAESRDVRQLLAYQEGTAGALMTTNFVALSAEETVGRAIEDTRRAATEAETIYAAYAVDPNGKLLGVVSLRDLVVAPADKKISDVMTPNVIAIDTEADQEEAARVIAKYDLIALPVTDKAMRVVGIITVDDVVDVIQAEATEDVQKLGAVQPLEDTYFQTAFWAFVRKRASWLVFLFFGELATGNTLRYFSVTFEKVAALVWFVPLILSSGGNAGSQSATLMIRALAVGEVRPRDFLKVMSRELLMGLALGSILCVVGLVRVLLWKDTRTIHMVMTITLTLIAVVTSGTVIGSALPLLLKSLRLDPAVSSTPFIASLSDVTGLFLYFEIARLFLF